MADILETARAAGLMVMLVAQIGREQYHSISGSIAALRRFGDAYSAPPATDLGRLAQRLFNRAALQIDDVDAQLMRDAAAVIAVHIATAENT